MRYSRLYHQSDIWAMKHWLTIIGIGEEGYDALLPEARSIISNADFIVGGARHLAMLPPNISAPNQHQKKQQWLSPLEDTIKLIENYRGKHVVVLASGDPMSFGIGVTLARNFSDDDMRIIPWLSAFTLALSRLQWAQHQVKCLTLHGRELSIINPYLQPKQKLLLLAHDGESPKKLLAYLHARDMTDISITLLSHLGHETKEQIQKFANNNDGETTAPIPDLTVIALQIGDNIKNWQSTQAGLPDDCYQHHGKITKQQARASAIAKLKPHNNALLWDLGAGTGAVAIEWVRAGGNAIALEQDETQLQYLHENIRRWGNPDMIVYEGDFQQKLVELPAPDAIFIGGGLTENVLEQCITYLKKGGRLVIHAVTLESQQILINHARIQGDLVKIATASHQKIGNFHGFKSQMELLQYSYEKP